MKVNMIDWKRINAVLIGIALSANVVKGQTEDQKEKLPTDELLPPHTSERKSSLLTGIGRIWSIKAAPYTRP